jgi:hypothetical protein
MKRSAAASDLVSSRIVHSPRHAELVSASISTTALHLRGQKRVQACPVETMNRPPSVCPEPVEGLSFSRFKKKQGRCFDKLSTNGARQLLYLSAPGY